MIFLSLVALFVLGAIVASFIGVIVARLNTGQSFLVGRSRCDACNTQLPSSALIPVVSYVISGGRATCCGARLSLKAPLAELLLGALFMVAYLTLGPIPALPLMLLALSVLLALVLYDLAHQILPFALLVVFIAVSAATGFALAPSPLAFVYTLPTALLLSLFLALIHFASRGRAMGFADAPFSFGLAILTGAAAFPGFIFSFWIGALIGIMLLLRRPRGSRMGGEVPFAPFLAAGFLLAYFTQWNPFIFVSALH
ncbi:MAG TPA: prepilin peptidase [Candidatus Paceibacterota bacterium]|nr:prepilin peptidase [Candidatus Paceibacterota bacterium]